MKMIKKLLSVTGVLVLVGTASITALAAGTYGAAAVEENKNYTVTEMLTYALQDEELAYSEYASINETFDNPRPFVNIIRAEQSHIASLEKLLAAYGISLPENTSSAYVTAPASLTDAVTASIQTEKNNIAMYNSFLAQTLPDDVKLVFSALKTASEHHLASFERAAAGNTGSMNMNWSGSRGQGSHRADASCTSCTSVGSGNTAGGHHQNSTPNSCTP